MRTGGLYTFDPPDGWSGLDDPSHFVRVFTAEPTDGVNPYEHTGERLRVQDELGAWIPWLLLEKRTVTFLIAPSEWRKTIKSRTVKLELYHIATSEGRGWLELRLLALVRGGQLRELSAPSARTRRAG